MQGLTKRLLSSQSISPARLREHLSSRTVKPLLLSAASFNNRDAPLALSEWFAPLRSQSIPGGVSVDRHTLNFDWFRRSTFPETRINLEYTDSDGNFDLLEDVPFSYFMSYLEDPPPNVNATGGRKQLYMAQQPPPSHLLPYLLRPPHLPNEPSSTRLWLGLTPTLTPLHRDPDHNLFLQLCGTKRIRLWEPQEGEKCLKQIKEKLGSSDRSQGKMRGAEMMTGTRHGGEKDLLEAAVWGLGPNQGATQDEWENFRSLGVEAEVNRGEALLIPKGWWHSVQGISKYDSTGVQNAQEVNASVNWWFREEETHGTALGFLLNPM